VCDTNIYLHVGKSNYIHLTEAYVKDHVCCLCSCVCVCIFVCVISEGAFMSFSGILLFLVRCFPQRICHKQPTRDAPSLAVTAFGCVGVCLFVFVFVCVYILYVFVCACVCMYMCIVYSCICVFMYVWGDVDHFCYWVLCRMCSAAGLDSCCCYQTVFQLNDTIQPQKI